MNKCSLFTRSVLEQVIEVLHHSFAAWRLQVGEEHGALAARQASPLRLRLRHGLLVELLHSQHVHKCSFPFRNTRSLLRLVNGVLYCIVCIVVMGIGLGWDADHLVDAALGELEGHTLWPELLEQRRALHARLLLVFVLHLHTIRQHSNVVGPSR